MTRSLDQALLQGADVSAMGAANLLVNGFHTISQQFGSTAQAGSGTSTGYVTDQWEISRTGTMATSSGQIANPFPSQPDIANGMQVSITTAEAALAAGDNLFVFQPLEGINLACLLYGSASAKPVTLAFMIRPSIALTGYVSLATQNSTPATIRTIAQRFTAPANTDTLAYLTIPGDQAQALLTGNGYSLGVRWCFGAGTTYQGAAGVWSGSNVLAGADVTNLAAAVGNSVIISGAVMLPGVVPITQAMLPLLARQYDSELRKCQRYYRFITMPTLVDNGGGAGSGCRWTFTLSPKLRLNPSASFAPSGSGNSNVASYGVDVAYPESFSLYATYSSAGQVILAAGGILALNARM